MAGWPGPIGRGNGGSSATRLLFEGGVSHLDKMRVLLLLSAAAVVVAYRPPISGCDDPLGNPPCGAYGDPQKSSLHDEHDGAIVKLLPDGPVRGLVRENTIEFLGVPYAEPPARRDSAEHFFRSNALHCTATARILIPAECSAVS